MRLSIWPNASQPWHVIRDEVKQCEASGWDGVYVADHFMPNNGAGPVLEAGATVAALAAVVPRVRIGTLVLGNTYRHPAVVANMAATVDRICGGRLVLGVGTGWQVNEHEQYGITLPPVRERLDRFEEAVQVLRGLLTRQRFSFAGEHYTVTDATCEPKPVQSPLPILIGGKGDRMMNVVARYADEWNMWSLAPQFAERSGALDAACERIGRDPATIARSTQALWFLVDDAAKADALIERVGDRAAIGGSPDRLATAVGAWRDAGVDEVIVPDFTLGTGAEKYDRLDAIIEQVAPAFR